MRKESSKAVHNFVDVIGIQFSRCASNCEELIYTLFPPAGDYDNENIRNIIRKLHKGTNENKLQMINYGQRLGNMHL